MKFPHFVGTAVDAVRLSHACAWIVKVRFCVTCGNETILLDCSYLIFSGKLFFLILYCNLVVKIFNTCNSVNCYLYIILTNFISVRVYYGLKSSTSLQKNVSFRVLPSNLQEFSLLCACPSNKHCPSARCAYAANVTVGKDLDIFALGAGSFYDAYAQNC
jgi:hypothetical protein